MPSLDETFDFFSKRQYEFQLAWGVFGQVSSIFAFEAFAMLLCDKFGIYGLPSLSIYVGIPVVAVILVTWTGHKMIKTGYAHKYMKYGQDANKDWKETVTKIDALWKIHCKNGDE